MVISDPKRQPPTAKIVCLGDETLEEHAMRSTYFKNLDVFVENRWSVFLDKEFSRLELGM